MALEQDFRHAVTHMKRYNAPVAPGRKLMLYGLFKQARQGDCKLKKPKREVRTDDLVVMKWEAWKNQNGMSKKDAKKRYIDEALNIDASMSRKQSKCTGKA